MGRLRLPAVTETRSKHRQQENDHRRGHHLTAHKFSADHGTWCQLWLGMLTIVVTLLFLQGLRGWWKAS
jgi:hypothetical protein